MTYAYSQSGDLMRVRDFDGRATTFTVNAQGQLARRDLPGGSSQRFTYDQDGNLTTDTVIVGSPVRKQQFTYDARRSRTSMVDGVGPSDNSAYNALGQLTFSTNYIPYSGSTSTSYTLDALGNITKRSGAEASITWVNGYSVATTTSNNGDEWQFYKPGTGRLWYTKIVPNPDTTGQSQGGGGRPAMINWYDAAGNQTWTGSAILRLDGLYADGQSERRMYYGSDGKLRAVDARALYRAGPSGSTSRGFARSFEEYRYDALGRRVATRFDQTCDDFVEYNRYNAPCHVSGIRRTIWDGSQELGEIQLPSEHLENDTYVGQGTLTPNSINLAPYYGAVAYIHDGQVDQPLAITRLRYSNLTPSNTISELAAFTFYPVWDIHGVVPNMVGMGPLPAAVCPSNMAGGTKATCLSWVLQQQWLPYRDVSTLWPRAWHGTLLQDKAGAGGLMYRRNRYYDSKSGRFTQEDPIGLAGGLNVYGYANGDPVNYADPLGLAPCRIVNPYSCRVTPPEIRAALRLLFKDGPVTGTKKLRKAVKITQEAQEKARTRYRGFHNGKGDAFKHAYWSCEMTQEIGGANAKNIADAHEDNPRQPAQEYDMDIRNNTVGRVIGGRGGSCDRAITEALNSGQLQTQP